MSRLQAYPITRRSFLGWIPKGLLLWAAARSPRLLKAADPILNDLYWIRGVPDQPFYLGTNKNYHAGIDNLLVLMGKKGLKFYRSSKLGTLSGPAGLISANDIVLLKVNAQWKYRGCTNSDLIRGLIQKILEHPDTFKGEVVIFDNGQGRGSLNCDTSAKYSDDDVHANANNEQHSFTYLASSIFKDPRVTTFLLDPIRATFISSTDHVTNGYRLYENVSYPCFTTAKGNRVELYKGIWNGTSYSKNLKLINIPVLKHHDVGGSEITASLKHVYGILSMADGQSTFRHYDGLGQTCGKMMVSVCKPVLNIIDAVWVSHLALSGYPASSTYRANQLLASQDPVALDYWAAKYVLYPIDENTRHHPGFSGINAWLTDARDIINARGGMTDSSKGIVVGAVTKNEAEMRVYSQRVTLASRDDLIASWNDQGVYSRNSENGTWTKLGLPAACIAAGDLDGDGLDDLLGNWPEQEGVWVKYSSTGIWSKLAGPAQSIAAGDMNRQGKQGLLGSWASQGVFYRDPVNGAWTKMASPASQILAADLDGDGRDDLIGVWPEQDGVWAKFSGDSTWMKLAAIPDRLAVGDMNGDGRVDLVGSWPGLGVFYRDSRTGTWVQIAAPAADLAAGDIDGDGVDDLIGTWTGQPGVWVKYSKDGSWEKLSSPADAIATGRMRKTSGPLTQSLAARGLLEAGPPGPNLLLSFEDLSSRGPGGMEFTFQQEKNPFLESVEAWRENRVPGPGEPGFRCLREGSLFPQDTEAKERLKKDGKIRSSRNRIP